jgi:hypothetical protein
MRTLDQDKSMFVPGFEVGNFRIQFKTSDNFLSKVRHEAFARRLNLIKSSWAINCVS